MILDDHILGEFDQLFDARVRTYCDIAGPASETDVDAAEMAIGLDFPKSYRLFLSRYGAFNTGFINVYGLFDEATQADDGFRPVAELTNFYRTTDIVESLKSGEIIFIAEDQDGISFYTDATETVDGQIPVFASNDTYVHQKVAGDFLEFLRQIIQSDIQSLRRKWGLSGEDE